MIPIFIGYDPREAVAYNVLSHSIQTRASSPVSITPLNLNQLAKQLWRERDPLQSTDFSFSRFLVPYLCDFTGWALFMDCDMLMLDDVVNLWDMRDENYSVMCVKHEHIPQEEIKFLGAVQTRYEKKNWSSVMLFNCSQCTSLTPEYVNQASGLELHRFQWLENESEIGDIPSSWNHLVDYDPPLETETISNLHYTIGGPYFEESKNCSYATEWFDERESMLWAISNDKQQNIK